MGDSACTDALADLAASRVSDCRWALADARDRGLPVAEDIGFDSSGQPTTDPGRIIDGGAIQVFDR